MPQDAKILYEMMLGGDKIIEVQITDGTMYVYFESFWATIEIPFRQISSWEIVGEKDDEIS